MAALFGLGGTVSYLTNTGPYGTAGKIMEIVEKGLKKQIFQANQPSTSSVSFDNQGSNCALLAQCLESAANYPGYQLLMKEQKERFRKLVADDLLTAIKRDNLVGRVSIQTGSFGGNVLEIPVHPFPEETVAKIITAAAKKFNIAPLK